MGSSPTERTAGSIQVTMPQMGISVAEGTILEWRKQPGDWIEADETICDVSTDKVDVEIPAPASGRLERILAEPGQTVAVGTAIAEIDAGAQPGEAHPAEARPVEEAKSRGPQPPEVKPQEEPASVESDRSRFYSPVVQRIADRHGVDLTQVRGTGIGGRIRKKDVLAFIEAGNGGEPAPAAERSRPLHTESPYRPEPGSRPETEVQPTPERGAQPAADAEGILPRGRREPMSAMRRQIARHMVESRHTSAHCTTVVEVDFSAVARRRQELAEAMGRRGVKLTYLAFVARAAVGALADHPVLNASIEGEEIVYHDDVNLGIAVALEDGLIVPVIHRAQRLSLEGMAAAIGEVADRARDKRLEPDDVAGGTFTITNPGPFGAVLATPIINQPQVAILDLEAVVKRPVAIEQEGADGIAIRPISYLCMSWDHRALDGSQAARFLATVRERLESWEGE